MVGTRKTMHAPCRTAHYGGPVAENPWLAVTGGTAGPAYAARFAAAAAAGEDLHGEARRVDALLSGPSDVLDAGCGTGRVAIRLGELGHRVVGVDLDASMLDEARAAAPGMTWLLADLAELDLPHRVDAVVAAGNLYPLLTPGTHASVLAALGRHLRPGGLLVTGFGLDEEHVPFTLPDGVPFPGLAAFDEAASAAGLVVCERSADWDGTVPYDGGGYAVSVLTTVDPGARAR